MRLNIYFATTCLLAATIGFSQEYTIRELPNIGAYDLNDEGYVVGVGVGSRPVLVTPQNQVIYLPLLPGGSTGVARGINSAAMAAGEGYAPSTRNRALLWPTPNSVVNLGVLPGGHNSFGSYGWAINDLGHVTGQSGRASGEHGFFWSPETGMLDVGAFNPSLSLSYGRDINNSDAVTGFSPVWDTGYPYYNAVSHAFVWRLGQGMVDMGTFDPNDRDVRSLGFAIDDFGHVAGWGDKYDPTRPVAGYYVRAAFWTAPGVITDIGRVQPNLEDSAQAQGMNNHDQVVGISYRSDPGFQSAFLWSPTHGMRNADSLVQLPGGAYMWETQKINDRGEILGRYIQQSGHTPVVLVPVVPNYAHPSGVTVEQGIQESGDLASLRSSDDNLMALRNVGQGPVVATFVGTAPYEAPDTIVLKIESRGSLAGIRQSVQLFDYAANQWVSLDTRDLPTSDGITTIWGPNPGRFIAPGTRQMQARVTARSVGAKAVRAWRLYVDRFEWTMSK